MSTAKAKSRITKTLRELASKERFTPSSIKVLNGVVKCTEIISDDNREYIVFKNVSDAQAYASNLFIKHFDDPEVAEELRWTGNTLQEFAEMKVKRDGIENYISYDAHHRVGLTTGIAYRTI